MRGWNKGAGIVQIEGMLIHCSRSMEMLVMGKECNGNLYLRFLDDQREQPVPVPG